MAVGLALGFVAARLLAPLVARLRLPSEDLRPVLLIALAVVLYAITALFHGSGFLAVFVFGLMLGDAALPSKREIDASTARSPVWPRSSCSSRWV